MPTRMVEKQMVGEREKVKGIIIEFVFIVIGAVAGALPRYRITSSSASFLLLDTLPINVLLVNVIGSFILGVFSILAVVWNLDSKYSLLITVGFCCGSLTTMSSFALETTRMLDERLFGGMAINIMANVGLSIGAIIAGRQLVNIILKGGSGFL
jgi:fluoride exporter